MSERRAGIVTVSTELLAQMLHLPDGHKIVDVWTGDEDEGQFKILVEGPTLPVADGCAQNVQYLVNVTESGEMVRARRYIGHFEARSTAPASDEEMRRLVAIARKQAEAIGPLHSNWDVISDAECILIGRPSICTRVQIEAALRSIEKN